mgnify:CR=1 FL=1
MLKILIVDDEPDICELIHKLIDWEELELTSLGSSQNGIDAMEIILRQKPYPMLRLPFAVRCCFSGSSLKY